MAFSLGVVITLITGSRLLSHREYVVCRDLDHGVPRWAAYTLTCAELGAWRGSMPSGPIPA